MQAEKALADFTQTANKPAGMIQSSMSTHLNVKIIQPQKFSRRFSMGILAFIRQKLHLSRQVLPKLFFLLTIAT